MESRHDEQHQADGTLVNGERIDSEIVRRLRVAAEDRAAPMRLMVVATVGEGGRPNARALILRGTDDSVSRLWFHTDALATKVTEISARPTVCAVAYDPRDGVQLRLHGSATLHTEDALAQRHWEQLDLAHRHLYEMHRRRDDAGEAGAESDPRARAAMRRLETARDDRDARRRFAVLEMSIESVDWFQTTTGGMRRYLVAWLGPRHAVAVLP